MSGIELGAAYISILPTTDKIAPGINKALKDAQKDADRAGKSMGSSITNALTGSLKGYGADTKAVGKTAGDNIGKGITSGLRAAETQSKASGRVIGKNLGGGIKEGTTKTGGVFSSLGRESIAAGRTMGTNIGSGIQSGVRKAAPAITGALGAAVLAAGGLGLFGIKTAAGFEQSEIAFSTLLKSTARGKKEMAWLTKTAAVTPFETKDLVQMDKTLLSFGFTSDDLRKKWVLNMGNIAAAVGLPADRLGDMSKVLGQVHSAGTAQLEDINQLADAGVPIWDALSKQTGKSIKELRTDISKGKLTADTFFKALDSYTGKNFSKAMESQSKSINGMWSSITDAFSMGAAKLVTPLLPFISNIMPKVSGWMGIVGDKIGGVIPKAISLGKSFKEDVLPGIVSVATTVKNDLLPPLLSVGSFIVTHLPLVLGLAAGIASIVVAVNAWRVGVAAFTAVQALYNGVIAFYAVQAGTATAAQIALNTAMSANVIGIIVLALIGLVAGIIYAYKHFEGFRNLVNTVWAAIQVAIGFAWNNIIKPIFTAIAWFVTTVLAPAIVWFYSNIIKPYWTLIAAIFVGVWNRLIYPMFQFFAWVIKNVVAPAITWFYDKIVKPVFGAVGKYFSDQWTGKIKPVLVALGNFITGTVAPAISKGVDKVKGIWDKLQGIFLTPINFLIGTVYNNGIRKVINALPGVDDVPEMGLLGQGGPGRDTKRTGKNTPSFAIGGAVRGFGRKGIDSITAMLAPGEHVWTAKEVDAAGGQGAMYAMRKAILRHGGLGQSFDPPAFAGGGTLSDAQIKKAQDFAKSKVGSPYGWGSAGPNSFDCSGLMSAITNVIEGKNPYSRVGATGNFPWSGFESGPGQFTIGSTKNYGGSGVGHMAGTLGGMNVESRGGRGVVTGSDARGYKDSGFDTIAHLGAAGADGGFFASVKNILGSLKGWVTELGNMGGFGGLIKQMTQSIGAELKNFINDKVPGPGPLSGGIFDNGGILQPGAVAFNASNKPEAVFNHRQFAEYANDNKSQAGSGVQAFTITNWETGQGYFSEIADNRIDANDEYNNRRR